MTTWGSWKCPRCGSQWEGSIGWYDMCAEKENFNNSIPEESKPIGKLLISICGCLGTGPTEEQFNKMGGIYTCGSDRPKGQEPTDDLEL